MTETPIGSKVAAAFVKAQSQFKPVVKNKANSHFKNEYADLAQCLKAVTDALHANGLALMQKTYENENGITVETVFIHESGEVLEGGMLSFKPVKTDPNAYMSCLTYARRGSLLAACGLAADDDDGQNASDDSGIQFESMMFDHLEAIEQCQDEETLKTVYQAAYKACQNNATWIKKVVEAKDKVRKALK